MDVILMDVILMDVILMDVILNGCNFKSAGKLYLLKGFSLVKLIFR